MQSTERKAQLKKQKLISKHIQSFNADKLKPTQTTVKKLPVVGLSEQQKEMNQAEYQALLQKYFKETATTGMPTLTERMKGVPWSAMHGSKANPKWAAPFIAVKCDTEARPGYDTMMAHEYLDDQEVLLEKVKLLADMIKKSPAVVAYTGAGISTSSGISDYATKAGKNSLISEEKKKKKKKRSGLYAEPTISHRILSAMHQRDQLHHWVQQNHDGLPQKAGFPPEHLNEIHGAWFDPSNPVVPMSGTLRDDLCEWMYEWEERADLTMAIGTSLCGMNADRMVTNVAKRATKDKAQGAVIISIQRTQYDDISSLRIFAKIDDVMVLLAKELGISPAHLSPENYAPTIAPSAQVKPDIFLVPYTSKGRLSEHTETTEERRRSRLSHRRRASREFCTWDLTPGARIRVTQGPGKGFEGRVLGKNADGHYRIELPVIREGSINHGKGSCIYLLGSWWVQTATHGKAAMLPIVNIH